MTRLAAQPKGGLVVVPPPLHPGQLEVLRDPARFKILRAGRRWRKSATGVVQAFTGYTGENGREYKGALTGGQIGWWVPSLTARYLVADWEPIKGLAAQVPGSRVEEANHRVILPSGGSIMLMTGDTVDAGRGLGLDGAVIDEASLIMEALWTEAIRATLVDRLGWALFLFTPKGLNWCHALSQDAATKDGWAEFHYSSADNPMLDADELKEMAADMSTLVYRQEMQAEFVTYGAGMFERSWINWRFPSHDADGEPIYQLGDANAVRESDCRRFCTVDLAWSLEERADYTVIATWAVTPQRSLILLDVVRGHIAGPDIVRTMREVYERWNPGYFAVERANRQLSIVADAQRSGLPIHEVKAEKDKRARALPATARMESGQVWFPRPAMVPAMAACIDELVAFPMGQHDDFVDVLSYAVLAVARSASAYRDRGVMTV